MRKPFQSLRRAIVLSGVVTGLTMSGASAQEIPPVGPSPERPAITNPSWARRPLPEFPERAMARRVTEGSASVACSAAPDGTLSHCRIVSETPPGVGFGPSALSAARSARLSPESVQDAAPGSEVRFVLRYRAPDY